MDQMMRTFANASPPMSKKKSKKEVINSNNPIPLTDYAKEPHAVGSPPLNSSTSPSPSTLPPAYSDLEDVLTSNSSSPSSGSSESHVTVAETKLGPEESDSSERPLPKDSESPLPKDKCSEESQTAAETGPQDQCSERWKRVDQDAESSEDEPCTTHL